MWAEQCEYMLVRNDSIAWSWPNSHHITVHRGWTETSIHRGFKVKTTIEWPLHFHTASGRFWDLTNYRCLIISLFDDRFNWRRTGRASTTSKKKGNEEDEEWNEENRAVPTVLSCRYQRRVRSSKNPDLCFTMLPFWFESSWLFYTDGQVHFPFI